MTDHVGQPLPSRAEIIAVGTELLTPFRTDTNSLYLTARLNELGVDVHMKRVVGDDRESLAVALRQALERSDLVILTGGLGATDDDVTRDAVAGVLGLPLEESSQIVERIRARFASRGLRMPDINRRQAAVPRGAVALENPHGTAPGLWIEHGTQVVVLLPGPPRELQPMFEHHVQPRLAGRGGGARLFRRVLRVAGRTESHVEEVAQPVYSRWRAAEPPISTTILAAPGQIELHLTARSGSAEQARLALERATQELVAVLGDHAFSADGRTMEGVVGSLLQARGWTVAVAESCTGGLLTSRLTDVPGSSAYVERGIVAYSNRAKVELLGVSEALIAEHGAVSEAVAMAMATGVRTGAAADVGLAVTGIAGPGGGTEQKPVGTVAVAAAGPGDAIRARTFLHLGSREQVKFQATQAALDLLRRLILEVG